MYSAVNTLDEYVAAELRNLLCTDSQLVTNKNTATAIKKVA